VAFHLRLSKNLQVATKSMKTCSMTLLLFSLSLKTATQSSQKWLLVMGLNT